MRSSGLIARSAALIAVLFALAPATAVADLFAPGEIKEFEPLDVSGTVIDDPLRPFMIDFGGGEFIAGNVQDRIVENDDGRLSFRSYLRDITGSAGAVIESFSRGGFSGTLDVTWSETSLGGVEPSLGWRSPDGGTMTFFFSPGIPLSTGGLLGGNKFIAIHTDAPAYALIGEMFIGARAGSGQFGSTATAVFAPVPEPSAAALLVAGLAGLGVAGWRRRRRDTEQA